MRLIKRSLTGTQWAGKFDAHTDGTFATPSEAGNRKSSTNVFSWVVRNYLARSIRRVKRSAMKTVPIMIPIVVFSDT